jgi:hypothetical protein
MAAAGQCGSQRPTGAFKQGFDHVMRIFTFDLHVDRSAQ